MYSMSFNLNRSYDDPVDWVRYPFTSRNQPSGDLILPYLIYLLSLRLHQTLLMGNVDRPIIQENYDTSGI